MRRSVARVAAIARSAAIVAALLTVAGGCASKKVEPPKPPTESEYRERFTAERTRAALDKVAELPLREALDRHFAERGRGARGRGLRLAVDTVLVGERMNIGGGMQLTRTFVLYHEFDERRFTSYLEGIETIGGTIRVALRQPVGGSGKDFAELTAVDLNRAILDVYTHGERDDPCCPTTKGQIGYTLTGFSLEPLK